MRKLTMMSLFDGSGGFPFAASLVGIIPVSCSEIEPYPIAVTRSRFPDMKHLGDICKINGAEIEPVDLITFGSPCQDLSAAGTRAGLSGARSGLFMEAVRIIKEMREATNGKYPRYALWENVPGAFSSNKGEDFRTVLEELIKIAEPQAAMPPVPAGGWAYADCYVGYGWSLAYRVFGAQFWGVPQRRRRIHLILDLRGERAREILFERDGLQGGFAESREAREVVARAAESSVRIPGFDGDTESLDGVRCGGVTGRNGVVIRSNTQIPFTLQSFGEYKQTGVSSSLKARDYKSDADLVCSPDYQNDRGYIVRRRTPTEYARLQGFPDKWGHPDKKEHFTDEEYRFWSDVRTTHAKINDKQCRAWTREQILTWYNKLHTDSAEYKMWGNGIALPPAVYCMEGIANAALY